MIFRMLFLLGAAALTLAAQSFYFPLFEGNQWIYRQTGFATGKPITVVVESRESVQDRTYFRVTGFPEGPALLRIDDEGTLYEYDQQLGDDVVWARFGEAEFTPYETAITDCNETAVIESRSASFSGDVGVFSHALHITYPPGPCADGGIQEEHYLPYVGLLRRTVTTIGGPRSYELIYARIGGATFVSEPSLSFSIAITPSTVVRSPFELPAEPESFRARITLRNHFVEPFTLRFPSGQSFDLVIRNENGDVVYRWSDGRFFPQILRRVEIVHGETNWTVEAPLADRSGNPLPDGSYQVEAWLTNTDGRRFAAMAGLTILATP